MLPLSETQALLRRAAVLGDTAEIAPHVLDPRRLEIHRRHYESSLVNAVLSRFPATTWLVGGARIVEAARGFVRQHPPASPCIAEYGCRFPEYLAARPWAADLPYLESFAQLDQTLGEVAISLDVVREVEAAWPIDVLMRHFLDDDAPGHLAFEPQEVRLKISGGRGSFDITRESRVHHEERP